MFWNTTNSIKTKHRRQTIKWPSALEHHIYHQNQASKASNDFQKYLRPRQIASRSSIEDKQWLPERCPATTNSIRIKHRRKAIKSKSTSGHDKQHQKQASKASNDQSLEILKNLKISSLIFSFKFLTKLYHFVTIFTNLKPNPFSFVLES